MEEAQQNSEQDADVDPLDAFMASVQQEAQKEAKAKKEKVYSLHNYIFNKQIRRDDIEELDEVESFVRYRKEMREKGIHIGGEGVEFADVDSDDDSEAVATSKSKANKEAVEEEG